MPKMLTLKQRPIHSANILADAGRGLARLLDSALKHGRPKTPYDRGYDDWTFGRANPYPPASADAALWLEGRTDAWRDSLW